MARLSIIVPAVGSQTDLDETLVSVLEHRPAGCEVILAHPRSYVDPYDLSDEIEFVPADETDELSLFNAGINSACGQIVHTIRPGALATDGWCDAALERFGLDQDIGSVAPLVLAPQGQRRRAVRGVAYDVRRGKCLIQSARHTVAAPLVGTGFYRASAIRFMHGFDVRFGEYADVELGFRLRAAGYKIVLDEDCEVRSRTALRHRPLAGYRGGKLRASLFKTAHHQGMTSRLRGWWGFLGEPMNHSFGPATLSALLGHWSVWTIRSPKPVCRQINLPTTDEVTTRHQRRKAA